MEIADTRKPLQRHWFALYTTSRAEKRVAERLADAGIEYFLPTLRVQRKWSDRVKVVEVPLFSSYVFVNVKVNELFDLNKIEGVVKTVYYAGAPAIVQEREITLIRQYIAKAGDCEMITGDWVEVVCGPLAGGLDLVAGKITRVKKNYLYLYIERLGAGVCVKKCEVRKIH